MKTMIKTILLVVLCVHLPMVKMQAMREQKQIHNKKHHICEWISKSNGLCGQEYNTAATLQEHVIKMHIIQKHAPKNRSPYVCEWKDCKRKQFSFCSKTHFKKHLRTHTGEKPFSCKICSRAFTQNNNLHRHLRTHTEERPFSCNLCDKSFTRKDSLKKHLYEHAGKKPFSCNLCGKSFARKDSLLQHYKSSEHKMNNENFLDEIDNVPLMNEKELEEIFEDFENNHENND